MRRLHLRTAAVVILSLLLLANAAPTTSLANSTGIITFGDEDRSAELATKAVHQRYQFNTPTTVTYDKDTLTTDPRTARIYVADVGSYEIKVLDLNGRLIGRLDDQDTLIDPESSATSVPSIQAPLGIYFLSKGEAVDDRLAGLYVNDIGTHEIHFYHTDPLDPDRFYYVTSYGQEGHGGGDQMKLPRNLVVTPEGYMYVSDEFNHRVKGFAIDPATYTISLVTTLGWEDGYGTYIPAGPIIPGVDKDWGSPSTHYEDYASAPEKLEGFRIPQGLTYWRSPDGARTYLYVADNGNNRIKIYELHADGTVTLVDILGRFLVAGKADHLKRPRGVRTDDEGNLYVADTFNGRILKFENLGDPATGSVAYRASHSKDATATWKYGRLGLQQVEMRLPTSAATEDEVMQLPNDVVPLEFLDGGFYTENIWSWGAYYPNAPVLLVSDPGNHRIKKCWLSPNTGNILRCSTSAGVGGNATPEYWGHLRTLNGQLHYANSIAFLPANGKNQERLLVSDAPNLRINMYDSAGQYLGLFSGGTLSYGPTGLSVFESFYDSDPFKVGVLISSDATLPFPYTGDSSLRIYDPNGNYEEVYNLTYRTGSRSAPKISLLNNNFPVAIDIELEDDWDEIYGVYITTYQDYLWKFEYNRYRGTLTYKWVVGGPDSTKGNDAGDTWSLGPNFYREGKAGTFDQIQDVVAKWPRVYAVDRRNQRIQVFNSGTGAYVGKVGQGGGTYDHPETVTADQFFLPVGIDYAETEGELLVGDGFAMIARAYQNPNAYQPGTGGQISPSFLGYWYDPHLGTRPGGLFSAEHITHGNGRVYVNSLITNRITSFPFHLRVAP